MEIIPQPVELVSRLDYDPTTGEKEILVSQRMIKTSPIQSIGVAM